MDHALIERDALLERYVQGHLPPPVEEELEEHVVGCSSCQDELVAIRGLARGVRQVASEDAARLAIQVGVLARLRRALGAPGRRGPAAWAATGALVVLVGLLAGYAVWLHGQNRELQAALAAQTGRLGTVPETPEAGARAAQASIGETGRLAALEPTLPAAVGSVLLLTEVRGAGTEGEDAVPTIEADSLDAPFALAVYILDDPRFTSYRMRVVNADDQVVWQRSGLVPNAFEALMATFPPDFFPPGSYLVSVFGLTPDGDAVPLETYAFDVA